MLFIRLSLFLVILFAMLFVGLNNTQVIDFRFPIILDKPIKETAALLYFGVFSVGVVAGALFTVGGGKGKSKGASGSSKSKKD